MEKDSNTRNTCQSKVWYEKAERLKFLVMEKMTKALQVKAHKFSKKAKELIEKAGGQVHTL